MRIKVEVERGKGLVSTFFRGLLIEIWIGLFMSMLLSIWFLGCPFRVVVLPFAILSRKFGTKFPKKFEMTELFDPPSPRGFRLCARLRRDKTARQAADYPPSQWGFCLSRKLRRVRQQMIRGLAH